MTKFVSGALAITVIALFGAYALAWSGGINFSADTPHSKPVFELIEWVRERSIAKASSDVIVPPNLNDSERIRRGAGNYDAMCVQCHLSPGIPDSEIRKGLYPVPPNLSLAPAAYGSAGEEARQFWITKHGIKGSGMPAWSKGGMQDDAIWDLVAFLQHMPTLSGDAYQQAVAASDGHSHGGLEGEAHAHEGEAHGHESAPKNSKQANNADHHHDHDHSTHSH